jgi:hypothetical protein
MLLLRNLVFARGLISGVGRPSAPGMYYGTYVDMGEGLSTPIIPTLPPSEPLKKFREALSTVSLVSGNSLKRQPSFREDPF